VDTNEKHAGRMLATFEKRSYGDFPYHPSRSRKTKATPGGHKNTRTSSFITSWKCDCDKRNPIVPVDISNARDGRH